MSGYDRIFFLRDFPGEASYFSLVTDASIFCRFVPGWSSFCRFDAWWFIVVQWDDPSFRLAQRGAFWLAIEE